MLRTEEFLRRTSAANVPILGICFGHQLLGQALGGRVEKNPNGREIGTVRLSLEDEARRDPIFGELPQALHINMTHVDTVRVLPESARILARTSLEPKRGYLHAREQPVRSEGLPFDDILQSATDTPHGPAILRAFLKVI